MSFLVWPPTAVRRDPWFRRHPQIALAVAGLLYVGILALRLLVGGPQDAYSMLYGLPVALVAIAFGLRAGVAAGLVGIALTALWVVLNDVSLTVTGWGSRIVPLLLLGVLLGDAADRLRRSEQARWDVEAAALLHREAIEINDSLVQGMVAARWSLEAGHVDAGIHTLDETIVQGQDLVSGLINRTAGADRTRVIRH